MQFNERFIVKFRLIPLWVKLVILLCFLLAAAGLLFFSAISWIAFGKL